MLQLTCWHKDFSLLNEGFCISQQERERQSDWKSRECRESEWRGRGLGRGKEERIKKPLHSGQTSSFEQFYIIQDIWKLLGWGSLKGCVRVCASLCV